MAMFFVMNNVANLLRIPMLVALTSGLGINYLISNVVTLAAVFVGRFAISDSWIWAGAGGPGQAQTTWNYDIHGIVSVCSDGRLPELERFRISEEFDDPTIRVRLGELPEVEGKDPADRISTRRYARWGLGCACMSASAATSLPADGWSGPPTSCTRTSSSPSSAGPSCERVSRWCIRLPVRQRPGLPDHGEDGHRQDDDDPEDPGCPPLHVPLRRSDHHLLPTAGSWPTRSR